MLSCIVDHTVFLPSIASGDAWLSSAAVHEDALVSRMEMDYQAMVRARPRSAPLAALRRVLARLRAQPHPPCRSRPLPSQLGAIRHVEYPILGVSAARNNANMDDADPEDELEEEDEEVEGLADTDDEEFETDDAVG